MLSSSVARYRKRSLDAKARGIESTTSYGKRIMSEAIPLVAQKIDGDIFEAIDTGKGAMGAFSALFLHDKDTNKLAAITCRGILDMISSQRTYTSVAVAIGNMVADEVIAENMKVMRKPSFNVWKSILKRRGLPTTPKRISTLLRRMQRGFEFSVSNWTGVEKIQIGSFLINCFIQATGLVEIKNLFGRKGKTVLHLVPTELAMKWIADYNNWAEVLSPVYLPMVLPPKKWESGKIYGGGYDIVGTIKEPMIKSKNKKFLRSLEGVKMDEVVNSLNTLQETPFKINSRVFDVMMDFWERGNMVGDLVVYKELPLPAKLDRETATKDQIRSYYKEVAMTHCHNDSSRSRALLASKILYVAKKFRDAENIYFPHQVDFRGRAYPMPVFLNPQGNDLAKSLLLFSNGKPIKTMNERDWLLIFGANLYGLDKKPLAQRIEWAEKNHNLFNAIAKDPYENRQWVEADSPWLFLAFCFEFAEFAKRGYGFVSHLPISVDATNNGLQILSMLARDEVGAKHTNVIPSETPQYIYGFVADATVERLKRQATESANEWLSFGINRKTVKRPVMTLPYGSTIYSCRQYIEEWYFDAVRAGKPQLFDASKTNKKTQLLANEVWASMDGPIGKAREVMKFIQGLTDACTKAGVKFSWVSPCGMVCTQEYFCQKSRLVMLLFNGRFAIRPTVNVPTDRLNPRQQRNGASPNVVHSLDSSALHKTVNLARSLGVGSFMMIHDSYGALASDVETVLSCAKKSFIDIFSKDQLQDILEQVKKILPKDIELPKLPNYGSLNIEELFESKYFMS